MAEGLALNIAKVFGGPAFSAELQLPATTKVKVLEANKRRVYFRLQALNAPTIRGWFGPTTRVGQADLDSIGFLLDGDLTALQVFEQIGEHCWKGEIWVEAASAPAALIVVEHNENQFKFL